MRRRALVIGHRGGVGATLMHLLDAHPAGRAIASRLDALFVVDSEASPSGDVDSVPGDAGAPWHARRLDPTAARDPESLARTLRDHRIDQVIEVADVDTAATSAICAAASADYLSASIMGDAPTLLATRALLGDRPDTRGTSQLLGAGMNPGVVNALVLAGIDDFARRTGVSPAKLDLNAIHVTEHDTTAELGPAPGLTAELDPAPGGRDGANESFAMSWSPEHALAELLEPHSMYVDRGQIATLDHGPCAAKYLARCGDREIAGMLVPHEELISIGVRFPDVETAFFYAIPEAAETALARYPDRRPEEWTTRRLYGPHMRLTGRDRVGVLLASRRYGELWIGYEHPASMRADYGTPEESATTCAGNGTLLQAAAGVLAGWSQLGSRAGIHSVDELDTHAYLAIVESVLGRRRSIYVPEAMARSLAERRLSSIRTARRACGATSPMRFESDCRGQAG